MRREKESDAGRKRILFIASSAPRFPGDATAPFILNMAKDLGDLGWFVEILAPHAPGSKRHEIIEGVTIHRFRYLRPEKWQTLCYNGGAAINLKRNKLHYLAVPFLVIAELIATFRHFRRRRPALIHSHWIIPQGVIGQIVSRLGVPHVVSVHGTDIYGFHGRAIRAIKAWALRRADHVIANSTATKMRIESLCHPRSLSVIPTGTMPIVQKEFRQAQREEDIDRDSHRVLLFVGRLVEAKGVHILLDALPRVLAMKRVKLVIVGDGPERPALERQSRAAGLDHAVLFTGAVPHSSINEYFSEADVFVCPSLEILGESNEAQGNAIVEALFAGVPVVASRVGGIPDAIIHERTGLLVDDGAPDQIAHSVLRILSDQDLAMALRNAGRLHAEKLFSRLDSARKIDVIYRSLLGTTQSPSRSL